MSIGFPFTAHLEQKSSESQISKSFELALTVVRPISLKISLTDACNWTTYDHLATLKPRATRAYRDTVKKICFCRWLSSSVLARKPLTKTSPQNPKGTRLPPNLQTHNDAKKKRRVQGTVVGRDVQWVHFAARRRNASNALKGRSSLSVRSSHLMASHFKNKFPSLVSENSGGARSLSANFTSFKHGCPIAATFVKAELKSAGR